MKKNFLTPLILGVLLGQSVRADSFEITNFDFATLYNSYRLAQPKNVPWAGSYWAYGTDGIAIDLGGKSPAKKFDEFFKLGGATADFEKENHSCKNVAASEKDGCESWWGHCNAWAAAAIREAEPRKLVKIGAQTFGVGDQKAYLSEAYMEINDLFSGNTQKGQTTGDWIHDKNSTIARKIVPDTGGVTFYEAFWDVTPKTFFLIFTNYIGINKIGVIIDEFTGEQVWNQPVVGYKLKKLTDDKLSSFKQNNKTIYTADMTMDIYYASDGVAEDHVSSKFDINKTNSLGSDYIHRALRFKLFFDAPVKLDSSGNVTSAGRIIGDGIWRHQEHPDEASIDHSHPDFIWLPNGFHGYTGYGNPEVTPGRVYKITKSAPTPPTPPAPPGPVGPSPESSAKHVIKIRLDSFSADIQADKVELKGKIFRRLRDGGIESKMSSSDLQIFGDHVEISGVFPNGESLDKIYDVLEKAGLRKF